MSIRLVFFCYKWNWSSDKDAQRQLLHTIAGRFRRGEIFSPKFTLNGVRASVGRSRGSAHIGHVCRAGR